MSAARNFLLSARRSSSVFNHSAKLGKFHSIPTTNHRESTTVRLTMGSSSPAPAFARLGETALFKPIELGEWNLQHRIVQVGHSRILTNKIIAMLVLC